MFDFLNNDEIVVLMKIVYELGVIVFVVCYGIVGQIFYFFVKIFLKYLCYIFIVYFYW